MAKGMTVAPNFTINKELTSPPKPLTEGTLLGKMEKHSLGTPATRAEIIEKLIKSELMERTNSGLSVSAKGKQLLDLVNPSLVTPELTEKWEKSLEAIASGQQKSQLFLKDIEEDTKKLVREIKQSEKNIKIFPLRKKCPDCGSNLREKIRKMGRFTFVQTKNVLIVGEKILKYPITVAHNAIKNGHHRRKKWSFFQM